MKKKILIITPECPYPLNSGGRQAQFHFIDKLRFKYDLSIILPKDSVGDDDYNYLISKWDNVTFYPYINLQENVNNNSVSSFFKKSTRLVYNFLKKIANKNKATIDKSGSLVNSSIYKSLLYRFSTDFLEYIYNISQKNYDIIQVEFYYYLPLVHLLPKDVTRIFIHHEIRYTRNDLEKTLYKLDAPLDIYMFELSKMYEIANLKYYDKIVVLSQIDKQKLSEYIDPDKIYISPSLVKSEESIIHSTYKFNNRLVFLGNSNHDPNEDGLTWFLLDIWPKIRKENNELELHLIGKWDSLLLKLNIPTENIVVHGYVKNLSIVLLNSIMIVPIRVGSGIRMKILDSINYHVPFITTSIGVEGLDFENGKDCLIANDSDDFVNCIKKLSLDEMLVKNIIDNAVVTLEKLYGEENLIQKRIVVYES